MAGKEYLIKIGMVVACSDWPMQAKQLKCVTAQTIFKGFMLRQTSRDYPTLVGQSILDMKDKHITFERRLRLAQERLDKELELDNIPGLSVTQREAELKDWAQAERNPQQGMPSPGSQYPLHDMLHSKSAIVKKNAKAIAALFPQFAELLQVHKSLETFGKDLAKGDKLNLTGARASWYFRNYVRFLKPLLTQERSAKNAMVLAHSVIFVKVRDVIGLVMTTDKHSMDTIQHIATLGKEALNVHLLVFTGDDVLPYLAALCLDLPVQLLIIFQACEEKGLDFDTSAINAQQMELCNKVCKSLVQHLSNHSHVTGEEADREKHFQSETFLIFVFEYVVKVLARKLNFEKPSQSLKNADNHKQRILPEGTECKVCGLDLEEDSTVHDFFCKHPLLEPLLATARDGKMHPDIQALFTVEHIAPLVLQNPEPVKKARPLRVKVPTSKAQDKEKEKKKQDRQASKKGKNLRQETV